MFLVDVLVIFRLGAAHRHMPHSGSGQCRSLPRTPKGTKADRVILSHAIASIPVDPVTCGVLCCETGRNASLEWWNKVFRRRIYVDSGSAKQMDPLRMPPFLRFD
jgi:hypothetical protein